VAHYASLFASAPPEARVGESTPEYLFSSDAPERIASAFPAPPRMVAILPPPMDQATRQRLAVEFRDDNLALAEWLGRDLSGWAT